ncbi:hypothetical protein IIB79_04135 [candidate division KSB1 bacterium]|nr:hypothetical protein [candidate division KSB1 bacterium]
MTALLKVGRLLIFIYQTDLHLLGYLEGNSENSNHVFPKRRIDRVGPDGDFTIK